MGCPARLDVEPFITARTGLSVADHQRRTVDNLLQLRALDPDLPIIPVLQGWTVANYLHCADLYERSGINLAAEPLLAWDRFAAARPPPRSIP